jgi:hypothetical protein
MFAGHVGVALALGSAERRVRVGVFVTASMLLDIVLWLLVLSGAESVAIPADFARTHQPEFVFPWSHGLAASLAWAALAALAAWPMLAGLGAARTRAAALVAAAVFSHWLLDVLVHRPELPLLAAGSPHLGLGLWDRMPTALGVESALVALGLWLFLRDSRLPRRRSLALAALVVVLLAFTVVGMTVAPPPPSAGAMAATSLLMLLATCALADWLGRPLPPAGARSMPAGGRGSSPPER